MFKLLIIAVNQGSPRFHEVSFKDRASAEKAKKEIDALLDWGWRVTAAILEVPE